MSIVPLFVDMILTDGTVEDISEYSRDPFRINRGKDDEADEAGPGSVQFELNNIDGRFSPRNPLSPYFGLFGRNTLIRVRVESDNAGIAFRNNSPVTRQGWMVTPDHASLDIVADIDIRVDISPETWTDRDEILTAKYTPASDQRSWAFVKTDTGALAFIWSTTGTAATEVTVTSAVLPAMPAKSTVRVTLDANNGAAQREVRFWTGTTGVNGTFTQHGATDIGAVTSIFSSTANLGLGSNGEGTVVSTGYAGFFGVIHGFQLRSSINGTVVAEPNMVTEPFGTLKLFVLQPPLFTNVTTDTTGKQWLSIGQSWLLDPFSPPPASIVSFRPDIRAAMEVADWPQRWNLPGTNVWSPLQAAGILRRLGKPGQPALDSVGRYVRRQAAVNGYDLINYWPLLDPEGTRAAASFIGSTNLRWNINLESPQFGKGFIGHWYPPAMLTGEQGGSMAAPVIGQSGGWTMDIAYRAPDPATWGSDKPSSFNFGLNDVAGLLARVVTLPNTEQIRLDVLDADGATLNTTSVTVSELQNGETHHLRLHVQENAGTTTDYFVYVDNEIVISEAVNIGIAITPAPVRPFVRWSVTGVTVLPVNLGQVILWGNTEGNPTGTFQAYMGNNGETTAVRFGRLLYEDQIDFVLHTSTPTDCPIMGPQPALPLVDLLDDIKKVDGGIIQERRDSPGLEMYPLHSLQNRDPDLSVQYDAGEVIEPFQPDEDDRYLRNDVTVKQAGFDDISRSVDTTGPLGVDTVGLYEERVDVNVSIAAQLAAQAGQRLLIGTWNQARYGAIAADMRNFEELLKLPLVRETALEIDGGFRVDVTGLPAWLPPENAEALVQGYVEDIDDTHKITWHGTPYGPYRVAVVEDQVLGRVDTSGSELTASVLTGTATAMTVLTTEGPVWNTDAAEYPDGFEVVLTEGGMEGAKVLVTAIASPVVDTFTRVSVNSWGNATPTGQTWALTGTAANFDVDGNSGTIVGDAGGEFATLGTFPDVELLARLSRSTNNGEICVVARWTDINNHYRFRMDFATGSHDLSIFSVSGGVATSIAGPLGLNLSIFPALYFMRVRLVGTLLQMKVWRESDGEPPAWHLEATSSVHTTGAVGCGNINATGLARFHDFSVTGPQTFTIDQTPTNGVIKTVPAGSGVRLAQSPRPAL